MELVLVGDDGSDGAAVAIAWATRFASERRAELCAVHVSVPESDIDPPTRVDRVVVREGHAAGSIMQVAHELDAAVIVMGRRGRTGTAFSQVIGGTAHQVATASDRPVVVVPVAELFAPGPLVRSVVVGIDGLPESSDAAAWVVRTWPGARFTAIHALELAPAFAPLPDEQETNEAYRRVRARADRLMRDRWCRPFAAGGVTFECVVEEGNAVEILLAAVTRTAADVVVVSRRDHHLRRGTLGGVSQRVLAHAACAVMMVPSHS